MRKIKSCRNTGLGGITSDPNRSDDVGYITRLVKQVVQVSTETAHIVGALPDLGLAVG